MTEQYVSQNAARTTSTSVPAILLFLSTAESGGVFFDAAAWSSAAGVIGGAFLGRKLVKIAHSEQYNPVKVSVQ